MGSEYSGGILHGIGISDDAGMYVFSAEEKDVLFVYSTQNLLDGMRLLEVQHVELGEKIIRCDKPARAPMTFFLPIVYDGRVAGTLGMWWMKQRELEAVLT